MGDDNEAWRRRRLEADSSGQLRLLVPIIRELHASALLEIGDAVVGHAGGEGVALGVVEVPLGHNGDLTAAVVERQREMLRWIAHVDAHAPGLRAALGIQMRVAHDVALGIREAVYEFGSSLVLMEWPGPTSRRPRLLGRVIDDLSAQPPADLALVRPDRTAQRLRDTGRGILVPVRGGPNARLAVVIGAALARLSSGRLTLLHVYHPLASPSQRREERMEFEALVEGVASHDPEVVERVSDSAARAILDLASGDALIVLGAHADPAGSPTLIRSEIAHTLRRLPGTVVLVRTTGSLVGRPASGTPRDPAAGATDDMPTPPSD